ncbi:MAG: toll/interleukin-1 receptor domain-containing protein [Solirubrobacterales bacterium]
MAGPGKIQKPTVFISHAATDAPIAEILRDEIDRIFAGGVEIFASSVPGVIEPGADWLASIRRSLTAATAVIVVVSPTSVNRPWVWFEVGASWSRMEEGDGKIIPVCVPEIDKGELPEPLGRLQAMSLGSAAETKEIFKTLIDQFDFGKLGRFRHASIKARLPRYADLPLADADLRSGTIYTGPFQGYSEEELALVVDDAIVKPNWSTDRLRPRVDDWVFDNHLLHFRQVDEEFELPPGTSKKLLARVVTKNYPYTTKQETENTVRFEPVSWEAFEVWKAERGFY